MKPVLIVFSILALVAMAFSGCSAVKPGGPVNGDTQRISGEYSANASLRPPIENSEESVSGYDQGIYEMLLDALMIELERLNTFGAGGGDRASSFYNHEYDETDLRYDAETGKLSWRYTLSGDYDLSGEVGIPDITPIALHYGAVVGDDDLEAWIDGDGDGVIGVPDVTVIARNFGRQNLGSRVLSVAYLDDFDGVIPMDFLLSRATSEVTFPPMGWTEIAVVSPEDALISATPRFEIPLPAGTQRFVCVETRGKWGYSLSSWLIDLLTPAEGKVSVHEYSGAGIWSGRSVYTGRIAIKLKAQLDDENIKAFVADSGIEVDAVLPDGLTIGASLPAQTSVEYAVESFAEDYPDAVEFAEPSPVIWWWS